MKPPIRAPPHQDLAADGLSPVTPMEDEETDADDAALTGENTLQCGKEVSMLDEETSFSNFLALLQLLLLLPLLLLLLRLLYYYYHHYKTYTCIHTQQTNKHIHTNKKMSGCKYRYALVELKNK